MLKTYVKLNRQIGGNERFDDPALYELILPIKTDKGFELPKRDCGFFQHVLLRGEAVLLCPNGFSWNTLIGTDRIISIYQK